MRNSDIRQAVIDELIGMRDEIQARHLMRFFKTGPGEYGEGDKFLGIRCPQTRSVVKRYRKDVELSDSLFLIESPWHEIRLAGFLLMIEIYERARKRRDERAMREVVDCYLYSIPGGNNWDLVDMVAPKILGKWLVSHPDERIILDSLASREKSLWHNRVAIVANWMLIREGIYEDTFRIAELLLDHPHDLIHKATGWMLREVGKRGGKDQLLAWLDTNTLKLHRTALRYAIERFPEAQRQHYLHLNPIHFPK